MSKVLGRGLSAFLEHDADEGDLIKINVNDVVRNPYQPRKTFDDESLQSLSDSIKRNGVLQPIIVIKLPDGGYQLVAGERRLRASKLAGISEVPAILTKMNDKEQLEVAILENIQRENLNPLDEATSYKRLIDEFNHTQEELATILGKSRSHISNTLRLLSLPENVKEELKNGKLSFGHARALVGIDDAESLAKDVISKSLNVRETENLVRSKKSRNVNRRYLDPEVVNLAEQISSLIGLDANIKLKGAGGVVEINFNSLEELDSLMKYLHK